MQQNISMPCNCVYGVCVYINMTLVTNDFNTTLCMWIVEYHSHRVGSMMLVGNTYL